MVRRADAGGGSPTLYGWAKVGHATVYEHEPGNIGLDQSFRGSIRNHASPIGCCKMCEKFWTLPNNLLFGESATFHSCAPMPGTLTFQWHTFRGEGQVIGLFRQAEPRLLRENCGIVFESDCFYFSV